MKYLFYSEEPEEGGTIVVEHSAEFDQYPDGENVTLKAVPAEGWAFSHWAEQDWGYGEPDITVCMTEDRALAAHFYRRHEND